MRVRSIRPVRWAAAGSWPVASLLAAQQPWARLRRPDETPTATPIKHFVVPDAGEPHVRQLLRHLPRRGRHPEGRVHARRARTNPDGPCVKPLLAGRESDQRPRSHRVASSRRAAQRRQDGRLRRRLQGRRAIDEAGDGVLRRPGPALLLEHRRQLRPLRPLLHARRRAAACWNHMYWVTGAPGNPGADERSPPTASATCRRSSTASRRRAYRWKFYVQNYDPSDHVPHAPDGGRRDGCAGRLGRRCSPTPASSTTPSCSRTSSTLDEYYEDLRPRHAAGGRRTSSPSGASEHPPGSITGGPAFVRTLHRHADAQLARGTSAFMWTYDDWGGWYDHVKPPQVDEYGYGFRAPALLVAPYARRGYVDSTTLDFTSMPEVHRGQLGPRAARRAGPQGEQHPERLRLLEPSATCRTASRQTGLCRRVPVTPGRHLPRLWCGRRGAHGPDRDRRRDRSVEASCDGVGACERCSACSS